MSANAQNPLTNVTHMTLQNTLPISAVRFRADIILSVRFGFVLITQLVNLEKKNLCFRSLMFQKAFLLKYSVKCENYTKLTLPLETLR